MAKKGKKKTKKGLLEGNAEAASARAAEAREPDDFDHDDTRRRRKR